MENTKILVNLSGPEGNAYYLLGLVKENSNKIGKDPDDIIKEMTSGNYDNLIKVFNSYFSSLFDLYY